MNNDKKNKTPKDSFYTFQFENNRKRTTQKE